jgi:hypothetical protein
MMYQSEYALSLETHWARKPMLDSKLHACSVGWDKNENKECFVVQGLGIPVLEL